MKQFLFLLLLFPLVALSQNFAVENNHNYVYKGVYNPLYIVVQGYPSSAIRIKATNGTVKKDEHGTYNLIPDTIGTASIIINVKTKSGLKKIGERYFRVKRLPTPEAMIGTIKGGDANKKVLLMMGGLRLLVLNDDFGCAFEVPVSVLSYKALATRGDSILFFIKNDGPGFSEKLSQRIQSLLPDDKLIFMEIIGNFYTGDIIEPQPSPIHFTIKETMVANPISSY